MANYWPGVWSDLQGAIKGAWAEVGTNGSKQTRAVLAERIDWKDLITRSEITPPYVVVQAMFQQDPTIGGITQNVYRGTVTVHRIEAQSGTNVAATIEGHLYDLQTYLMANTFTNILIWDPPNFVLDVTESNPVNVVMLGQQMPFSAGSLSFEVAFGE